MADASPAAAAPAPSPAQPSANPAQPTGAAQVAGSGDQSNPIKEAAAEAIRKHKLKVDGQEIEVDEDELKRGYSHQRAANKILQEGKTLRKQSEEFLGMMKDKGKLFEVIQKLGHDPRKLAEEFLAAQLEEEMLDPRERELKVTKSQLKRYEEMERAQKEAVERQRDEQLRSKFAADYTKQFTEALTASNLPPTKPMVAEMAKYISRAAKLNFQMTAAEAAQLVKEDIQMAHQRLYGESDAETLVKLLGEQGLQKIRQIDIARLKDPAANLKTPPQGEPRERKRSSSGERMTPQQWRAFKAGR